METVLDVLIRPAATRQSIEYVRNDPDELVDGEMIRCYLKEQIKVDDFHEFDREPTVPFPLSIKADVKPLGVSIFDLPRVACQRAEFDSYFWAWINVRMHVVAGLHVHFFFSLRTDSFQTSNEYTH
jgi:hypothetical protein